MSRERGRRSFARARGIAARARTARCPSERSRAARARQRGSSARAWRAIGRHAPQTLPRDRVRERAERRVGHVELTRCRPRSRDAVASASEERAASNHGRAALPRAGDGSEASAPRSLRRRGAAALRRSALRRADANHARRRLRGARRSRGASRVPPGARRLAGRSTAARRSEAALGGARYGLAYARPGAGGDERGV